MHPSEPESEQQHLLEDDAALGSDHDNALPRPSSASSSSSTTTTPRSAAVPVVARTAEDGSSWLKRNQWVVLALGSGACAAINAVFAKLTTTSSTGHLAARLAALLGVAPDSEPAIVVEVVLRGVFFALNLGFDAVMWTIFTQALARAASTSQVTVLNTSSNFLLSGLLGLLVFAEALPPQWWVGAALLVAGTFVVGRAGEADAKAKKAAAAAADAAAATAVPVPVPFPVPPTVYTDAADDNASDEDVADLAPTDDSILLVEPVSRGNSACGRRSPRLAMPRDDTD